MKNLAAILLTSTSELLDTSDEDLLKECQQDPKSAAFDVIYRRYGKSVLIACFVQLGDSADTEEAFQATWLWFLRRLPSLRPGPLGGLLTGTAAKIASRLSQKRQRGGGQSTTPVVPDPRSENPANWDEARVISAEAACLSERHRRVLSARYYEGLTRTEAAKRLGWPEGTVASTESRALDALGDRLRRRGVGITTAALALALADGGRVVAARLPRLAAQALTVLRDPTGVPASEAVRELVRSYRLRLHPAWMAVGTLAVGSVGVIGVALLLADTPNRPPTRTPLTTPKVTPATTKSEKEDPATGLPPREPKERMTLAHAAVAWRVSRVIAPNRFELTRRRPGDLKEVSTEVWLADLQPAADKDKLGRDIDAVTRWLQGDWILLPDGSTPTPGSETPLILKRAVDGVVVNDAIVSAGHATGAKRP